MITGVANDGCPKLDRGCPRAEDLGRGWVRAAPRRVSQGRAPSGAVKGGSRCSPEKYYPLYTEFWRGSRGRGI